MSSQHHFHLGEQNLFGYDAIYAVVTLFNLYSSCFIVIHGPNLSFPPNLADLMHRPRLFQVFSSPRNNFRISGATLIIHMCSGTVIIVAEDDLLGGSTLVEEEVMIRDEGLQAPVDSHFQYNDRPIIGAFGHP